MTTASDVYEIEVRLKPLPSRVVGWVGSAISSALSLGPARVGDSEIVVTRRGTGEVVGTIHYEAAGTLDLVRADAEVATPEEFVRQWGLGG